MGWYLKKSFGFGPLRLNLSKSGLGASLGVKGLRVSTGPKGAQLHAGREGLYYRKSLDTQPEQAAEGELSPTEGGADEMPAIDVTEDADKPAARPAPGSGGRQLGIKLLRGILGGLFKGR